MVFGAIDGSSILSASGLIGITVLHRPDKTKKDGQHIHQPPILQSGAVVARQPHKLEVVSNGANPTSASIFFWSRFNNFLLGIFISNKEV